MSCWNLSNRSLLLYDVQSTPGNALLLLERRALITICRGTSMKRRILSALVLSLVLLTLCFAQQKLSETSASTIDVMQNYRIVPNITYAVMNNFECKLDVYARRTLDAVTPTVISIHGGGWVGGTKEGAQLTLLPYLEMGFSVVNVEYRLARVSLAPVPSKTAGSLSAGCSRTQGPTALTRRA